MKSSDYSDGEFRFSDCRDVSRRRSAEGFIRLMAFLSEYCLNERTQELKNSHVISAF
jgi:hypothetical protein